MASGVGNRSESSKSFVARGWARISGRRKKTRFPNPAIPEDEPIEVAEVAHEEFGHDTPHDWESSPQKGRFNRGMDRLRRSLRESFHRKPKSRSTDSAPSEMSIPASTSASSGSNGDKNPAWHVVEDEVRAGRCQFEVKYLGSVEVFESRGMEVCENAMKLMRTQRRRVIKGVLYVSGDGLRVVDNADNHGLVVDQTIEKVSFCSPDRNNTKGFAYICRDGTTRRWMCHGFHAVKESGERLSHAVGCAFAICLEKKRKREATSFEQPGKETTGSPTVNGGFTNFRNNKAYSSFNRQLTISERLQDPQLAIVNEQPPSATGSLFEDQVVPRPQGNRSLLERKGSFKAPEPVSNSSLFRRQHSLKNDYTSRQNFNGVSMRCNEPIIEGEELWPESSVISQFGTFPTSSSLQYSFTTSFNQPLNPVESSLSSSAFQNEGWQGTPVKRAANPSTAMVSNDSIMWNGTLKPTTQFHVVKADDWLDQILKGTSSSINAGVEVPGPVPVSTFGPPKHPPPPLPPSAEKLAAALGTSPPSIDPFAKGYQRLRNSVEISFSEDLNPLTEKINNSTNSIAYSLLNESANNSATSTKIDLAVGCSNGSTDIFGQPIFNPVVPPQPAAPVQMCNGFVRTSNSTSSTVAAPSDDPFDVKWSALAISSAAAAAAAKSTNPFATNALTAAR